MFTRLESGAEVEMGVVTRWETGAETEADGVYAVKKGAEEQVWARSITMGDYTLGGFPDDRCSLWVNDSAKDEIRMGYRLDQSEPTEKSREIGFYIHGNFIDPVINCEASLMSGDSMMFDTSRFHLKFYHGGAHVATQIVVGYGYGETDEIVGYSDSVTRKLTDSVQSGTFDTIFLGLYTYVESEKIRYEYVIASIKNLTIDGKKIEDTLVIGTESQYD